MGWLECLGEGLVREGPARVFGEGLARVFGEGLARVFGLDWIGGGGWHNVQRARCCTIHSG